MGGPIHLRRRSPSTHHYAAQTDRTSPSLLLSRKKRRQALFYTKKHLVVRSKMQKRCLPPFPEMDAYNKKKKVKKILL